MADAAGGARQLGEVSSVAVVAIVFAVASPSDCHQLVDFLLMHEVSYGTFADVVTWEALRKKMVTVVPTLMQMSKVEHENCFAEKFVHVA